MFRKRKMGFLGWESAYFENNIMRRLEHPSILRVKTFFEDEDYMCIVNELMVADMTDVLNQLDDGVQEANVKSMFAQMAQAVAFCHRNGVVHRDVKLENFLVDTDATGSDQIIVKLSDFGLACHYDPLNPPTAKCGSLLSVAPEILTKETYCPKVDCWALGIVLF